MFGRKKNEDTLVLENEEFYNPPASDAPRVVDDSELLPVDEDDEDFEPEEDAPEKKERRKKAKRYGRAVEDPDDEVEEEPEASEWHSPVKPSLSLPSRSIVESTLREGASVRMRKVCVIAGAGLVAALVTCLGLNIYSAGQLTGVQAEGHNLSTSVKQLQPVADYLDGYNERRKAVSEVLTTDIQFSVAQNSLFSVAARNGVTVASETIVPGQPCPSIDPFAASEGLGCITAQISGSSSSALAKLADDLNNEKGLGGAYINGISGKDGASTATLNVNYDDKLLSERYRKFGGNAEGGSAASQTESKGQ
jgi:hypothetical protein